VTEQYVTRNSRTAWRVYDGEAVILLADDSTLNTLNPVGTLIWESADGTTPVSALVDRVCAEFDVEAARAERDVSAFIDKLHQRGLLEISATPHSGR
jgi:Coenzyme PQQ synthesis protein D (PqqD)